MSKKRIKHSSLIDACREGNATETVRLLKAGANVNSSGPHKVSPLMEAASRGFDQIVEILLSRGADVNLRTTAGETALAFAISNGHAKSSGMLIAAGASVDCYINLRVGKMSALTIASGRGLLELVALLLKHGASVDGWREPERPAVAAAQNGHLEIVRKLMESGANPNLLGNLSTPLTAFAARNSMDGVKYLLSINADVDIRDYYGMTPLLWACRNGHFEMAKLLVKNGADPLIRDQIKPIQEFGLNAIGWAIRQKHSAIVKFLMDLKFPYPKDDIQKAKEFLKK